MSDETSTDTSPEGPPPEGENVPAELLAEMRRRVDEASADIERLTAELTERSRALDELESRLESVLDATDTALVVVGPDRRVRAISRGAADVLELTEAPAGRPLSTVVPDEVARVAGQRIEAHEEEPATGSTDVATAAGWSVTSDMLDDGGVVLVLRRP